MWIYEYKIRKNQKKITTFKIFNEFQQVRVIQRILNETKYLEDKMKEYKENSNVDKLYLKNQIESLIETELIEDYQEIEKILSHEKNIKFIHKNKF